MANIDVSKLPPALQRALFEESKRQGVQPTSGGMPMEQAPTAGAYPMQAPQIPPQMLGAFKDNPQGAIAAMQELLNSKASGPALQDSGKGLTYEGAHPMFGNLGMKAQRPVTSPDFLPTLLQTIGEEEAARILPQGLPRKPDGTPFLSEDMFKTVLAGRGSKHGADSMPRKGLAKAFLSRVKDVVGEKSDTYKYLQEDLEEGLIPSKLGEYNATFGLTRKELDIFRAEDGRTYKLDRATEKVAPILGKVGGVLASFNPLELSLIKAEMKSFDTDPLVKDVKMQVGQLTRVSGLVESRNPSALGILASNIAKGLGREAGVLTEGDIARATGSQQLGDRWKRFWAKHTTGQLMEEDVTDFRSLMQDINKSAQKQLASAGSERAGRLSRILKRPVEEILPLVTYGVDFIEGEEKEAPTQPSPFTAARSVSQPAGQTKKGTKYRVIQ